jgi:hypothetical protein
MFDISKIPQARNQPLHQNHRALQPSCRRSNSNIDMMFLNFPSKLNLVCQFIIAHNKRAAKHENERTKDCISALNRRWNRG